eukprot:Skav212153  [mRNA]  locus=scaffold754:69984:70622:- [translate_table: standard]
MRLRKECWKKRCALKNGTAGWGRSPIEVIQELCSTQATPLKLARLNKTPLTAQALTSALTRHSLAIGHETGVRTNIKAPWMRAGTCENAPIPTKVSGTAQPDAEKCPTSPENRAAIVSCSLPVKTAEGMISPNLTSNMKQQAINRSKLYVQTSHLGWVAHIRTNETESTTASQDLAEGHGPPFSDLTVPVDPVAKLDSWTAWQLGFRRHNLI